MADDFLVVAIGASAGGVNAFRTFFEQVPADSGMAYVAILHLSPEYDSHLPEVLQRSSKIPVTTVQDRVQVEPNHAYVVSPRQTLTMEDGWLVQSPATRTEERRAPIDIFFRTLAEARGDRAVCIVLSGTGADGSMGLKRIKERGGTCLVQEPGEAEHDDMPRNAVATTLADDVLPVASMPGRLIAFRDRLLTVRLPEAPQSRDAPDERALHQVFSELRLRTGHDFSNYKRGTVLRRVERRLGIRQVPDLVSYAEFIREHPDEAQALLKDLLISVTQFFRDDAAFKALAQQIVPKLFEGKSAKDQVRVWVAGCATGEEAYSLAMLLSEHASAMSESPSVQIFATDIDEQAIAFAREGRYTINDAADVSLERLQRFFTKEGDSYRVRKDVRETVLFAHHNLVKDPPFSHLDLVSCRNLLIYLNHTAQERVMQVLHFALNPNGFLFLGASESAEGSSDLFAIVDKDAHIFQSRGGALRLGLQVPPLSYSRGMPRLHVPEPVPESRARERLIPPNLHQRLLEVYAPPSIVVNDEYEIVHMSERASRMLEFSGGEPSHNLIRVVRPELRIELRTALHQAAQHRTNVQTSGLRVRAGDGRLVTMNLTVRPVLRDDDPARGFFLVLFEEAGEVPPPEEPPTMVVSTGKSNQHLEDELIRVKSQLRNTIEQYETQAEELKASNEELQAINEELRSATEELETSREELQSLNEELRTVNQELKVKIEEQAQAANDIQNLINSTDFGTVFLDRAGRIKLFTPRARDIFRLIPSDRGRPLQDISSHLEEPDLSKDVERVLERLERVEREVFTRDGRWQLMRIAPYRTGEDKIDGVVLTFVDVTERKVAAVQLAESERRLRRALEVDTVGVLFIGTDGLVTRTNEAFFRLSGLSREDLAAGNLRWEDLAAPEKRAEFAGALDELRRSGRLVPYELECLRPGGATWWALVTGTRLNETEAAIFLVDITDRHKAVEELEEDDRRKNEFLAALAHELRNPLAPIAAGLEVLRLSGSVDGRAARAREVMERQVHHMIRLVEDLLEVSRITLGKIELRRESSDLAPILRTAIEACAPTFRSGQHNVTVDVTPEPLPLYGDPVRLVQVFTNLLRNAAKYTPEEGSVAITATREGGQAVIRVKDTGMGIPPKMLPRIFDLFTQGPLLPDGQFQSGLGIGLTLVRTLVESHGGQVSATSEGVGKGSTFTVRLPLMPAQPAVPQPEPRLPANLSAHRIVVVDDNHDAADSLGTLLSMLDADVHVSYTGRDALAMIAEHQPSIVFVDLGMPGMDGFEVAREARRRHPDAAMTLVALTGWGQAQAKEAVTAAGFDHHVTKPASMERLTEILTASPPSRTGSPDGSDPP